MRQTERFGNRLNFRFEQNYVGRFIGDIAGFADRDAQVRLLQRWRVIDAVADKRDFFAALLQWSPQFVQVIPLTSNSVTGEREEVGAEMFSVFIYFAGLKIPSHSMDNCCLILNFSIRLRSVARVIPNNFAACT